MMRRSFRLGALGLHRGEPVGSDDRSHAVRCAQVASDVADAEDSLVALASDHGPEPTPYRPDAVSDAVEEREVHEQPHGPCRKSAESDAPHAADRPKSAYRGDAAEVAILVRLRALAIEPTRDGVRGMQASLHRNL